MTASLKGAITAVKQAKGDGRGLICTPFLAALFTALFDQILSSPGVEQHLGGNACDHLPLGSGLRGVKLDQQEATPWFPVKPVASS